MPAPAAARPAGRGRHAGRGGRAAGQGAVRCGDHAGTGGRARGDRQLRQGLPRRRARRCRSTGRAGRRCGCRATAIWGHPELVAFIERLAVGRPGDGWPGLLVGDMAQPRGGPMRTGHASHQIGLDVDLWLTPMPDHRLSGEEREIDLGGLDARPRHAHRRPGPVHRRPHRPDPARRARSRGGAHLRPSRDQAGDVRAASRRSGVAGARSGPGGATTPISTCGSPARRASACAGTRSHRRRATAAAQDLAWWLTEEPWRPKPPGPPPHRCG